MENAIIQRVKNQLNNLKTLSEELEVQMALGKAEARDLFEQERENLSNFISKERDLINDASTTNIKDRRVLLTAVENLESALNASIPTKAPAYDKYKNSILHNIYELEQAVRNNYTGMSKEMKTSINTFKTKMDVFRVNLALHDKDDPEKVERVKKDFSEELYDVRASLSQSENEQTKLDQFVEDLSESFKYLRRAVDNISS